MIELIELHPAVFTVGVYWFFSAVVGGMPEPTAQSGPGYRWLHNSLHILAGNLSTQRDNDRRHTRIASGNVLDFYRAYRAMLRDGELHPEMR